MGAVQHGQDRPSITLFNAQTRMAPPSAPVTLADPWCGTRVVPTTLLAPHRGHTSTAPLPATSGMEQLALPRLQRLGQGERQSELNLLDVSIRFIITYYSNINNLLILELYVIIQ